MAELRHRAEIPMLVGAGVITLAALVGAVLMSQTGAELPGWAYAALSGLAGPFIAGLVIIRFMYWKTIANGVEVTERQLPEVHAIYTDLVRGMEIEGAPRLYIKNGNGALDAFASKCTIRRTYVTLFSDLVDLAYEHGDFEAIRFVLAHELGHIKCGHVDLWRLSITAVPQVLFLGRSVTRAQEYSADRCGAYYAPQGAKQMIALFAGKRVYRRVDLDEYFASIENHKDGFWLKFANFWSDHAVGFRRMTAIRHADTGEWDVHGRML